MNNAANNSGQTNVQVMNMLDVPQAQNQIEQYTMADNFLDGIPGSMLDWSTCHIVSIFLSTADPTPIDRSMGELLLSCHASQHDVPAAASAAAGRGR